MVNEYDPVDLCFEGKRENQKLLGMVAEEVKGAEGTVVFIDDDKRYLREVPSSVRFVDISEYGIDSADGLFGFICGSMHRIMILVHFILMRS